MGITTIVFEILALPRQRNIKQDDCYMEFFENHFVYYAKYQCEEQSEDESMPWKESKVDLHIYMKKTAFSALEKSFISKVNKWQVNIAVNGKTEDIWIFYESEKECEEVFEQMCKYFFNGNNN